MCCWVRIAWLVALTAGFAGAVPTAWAQPSSPVSSYQGVSPGLGNPPPALGRLRALLARRRGAPAAILTWPGFQSLEGGGSRFFVQTTAPVATEVRVGADRVEVVFPKTAIHVANSARWLETRHFNTPVVRARLERRGRDVVLVLQLRAAVTPRVSQVSGEGQWSFTYVDFEPGQWRASEPSPDPAPPRDG